MLDANLVSSKRSFYALLPSPTLTVMCSELVGIRLAGDGLDRDNMSRDSTQIYSRSARNTEFIELLTKHGGKVSGALQKSTFSQILVNNKQGNFDAGPS
jgi:hypothetical protein